MSDEIFFLQTLEIVCSFQLFTDYASSPKTSVAEASSLTVEGLYLYMQCKRNFAGAVWKRCRHGNLQHQLMPNHPHPPIRFTRSQRGLLGKFRMPDNGSYSKCGVKGLMLSRMHETSSKFTWWLDQSGTWRHFGPCTLQSSASGNVN